MADKKISALTAATTPLAGTEVLPIVQSGSTVKVANNDLRPKQIQSNATSGVLQIAGPAAAATRVMTTPDANFTVARTDAANSFTGDQTLGTGNLIQGTAAKGFNFTANSAAAGMTSQLLNRYEEGTWTPAVAFGGGSVGITYAARLGRYTRTGRVVTVSFYVELTNKGSSTGSMTISTLPFAAYTAGGTYPFYAGIFISEGNVTTMPTGTFALAWSDSNLYIRANGTTGYTAITDTNMTNTSAFYGTVTYEAA